jgi:hypothetical protein
MSSSSESSKSICKEWKKKSNVNPRTGRQIKENGPTYKKLQKECDPVKKKVRRVRRVHMVSNVCDKWFENKLVNPRTGRRIKENGPTYKKLQEECDHKITGKIKKRNLITGCKEIIIRKSGKIN